jgi:hypothetical protein
LRAGVLENCGGLCKGICGVWFGEVAADGHDAVGLDVGGGWEDLWGGGVVWKNWRLGNDKGIFCSLILTDFSL